MFYQSDSGRKMSRMEGRAPASLVEAAFPRFYFGVAYVFSAKSAGSCKLAAARKSSPKMSAESLGSKADSVEPKAKKPGSLSDH
jgi:hypothetical protein